ncbi:MAG TPA: thiamine diphosphokinase [Candidatus Bariatricus faecipullorum]|nr:thiamine diphosphokinase [Candidatus Bariatricus faecipullorum]
MSKAVIISGGALDEGFAEEIMAQNEGACVIGVDKGLEFLYRRGILPQYIVGDFDSIDPEVISYYRNETHVSIREYNPIKDASDTEIAIRLAMTLGSSEMLILGATGGRVDHLWANIQTLAVACEAGVKAWILDPRDKIWVTNKPCSLKKSEAFGPYLSIFPLNGAVFDFNLTGTKWPLRHHTLKPCDSLTVSNEFAEEEVKIDFSEGMLVIMQTRD